MFTSTQLCKEAYMHAEMNLLPSIPFRLEKKRVIDNFIFTKQKKNQILLQCIYDFPFYGIPLNLH
jgi:hypothetical protein